MKKLSHFDLKNSITGRTKIWSKFLSQNDSFFLSVKESEKLESFWYKNLGQILVPPVIQFFYVKMILFFSLGAQSKKIESFWPKNLGQILVPPVFQFFLGQNDLFFSQCTMGKKMSHFDLKIWVKFLFCQWLNFFRSKWLIFSLSKRKRKNWVLT